MMKSYSAFSSIYGIVFRYCLLSLQGHIYPGGVGWGGGGGVGGWVLIVFEMRIKCHATKKT